MTDAKGRLRAQLRATLEQASADDLAAWSRQACDALMASEVWRNARTVMVYLPTPGEVDLRLAVDDAMSRGVVVCAPRMDWDAGTMQPRVLSDDRVETRRHGVPEPTAACEAVPVGRIEVVLVPGLAFDRAGGRLGRGAGYYDRFLPTAEPAEVVGVCFGCQVVERVPAEEHDTPVGWILTELGLVAAG